VTGDDKGAGGLDLPRSQAGSSPQHLLTTLLADYWVTRAEHLPSAALVDMLAQFDVTPTGARAALSRLARRGVLTPSRSGRNSYYGITPAVVDALLTGAHRVISFGHSGAEWDGYWTVASFSLPDEKRELRYPVRSNLRWLGFAPLYDGMWVSPRPVGEQCQAALSQLGLTEATVFRAVELPGSGRRPIDAWDLDQLALEYDEFVRTFGKLRTLVRAGDVSAAKALLTRTRVMDIWRGFPGRDPDLPAELLPARWRRGEAHDLFAEIYDALGPLAAIRVHQIVEQYSPTLAELVTHHTTQWLLHAGAERGIHAPA
jgi:phenylacetic acid degradation operon negative regulatory protein